MTGISMAMRTPDAPVSTKILGINLGNTTSRYTEFNAYMRQPDVVNLVTAFDQATWAGQISSVASEYSFLPGGYTGHVYITCGMVEGNGSDTLANSASGVNDANFTALADAIITAHANKGLPWPVIVRPATEFNLGAAAWPWGISAGGEASFVQAWTRFVDRFRAKATARGYPTTIFKFDWNTNIGNSWLGAGLNPSLSAAYPGTNYVDFIGADVYMIPELSVYGGLSATPAAIWAAALTFDGVWGLNDIEAFANLRGKPMSFPEWGVGYLVAQTSQSDGLAYIEAKGPTILGTYAAPWMTTKNVAMEFYWNRPDTNLNAGDLSGTLFSTPLIAAAYKANFPVATGQPAPF